MIRVKYLPPLIGSFFIRGNGFLVIGPLVIDWRPMRHKWRRRRMPHAERPGKWGF